MGGVVVEICNALSPADLMVSCISLTGHGSLTERVAPRVQVWALQRQRSARLVALLRAVEILRRYKVDLLHSHTLETYPLARMAAQLAGVRVLVHSEHHGAHPSAFRRGAAVRRPVPGRPQLVERFLAHTPAVAQALAQALAIEREQVAIFPLGVDTDLFRPCTDRAAVRVALGLDREAPLVGWAAAPGAERARRWLACAAKTLAADGLRLQLVAFTEDGHVSHPGLSAAGGGGSCDGLQAAGTGTASRDLPLAMAALDYFVIEDSGGSTALRMLGLQAMASGAVVVRMSRPEIPARSADEGWREPEQWRGPDVASPSELVESLRELVGDSERRAALAEAGRRHVLDEHPLEAMVVAHRECYLDLLAVD